MAATAFIIGIVMSACCTLVAEDAEMHSLNVPDQKTTVTEIQHVNISDGADRYRSFMELQEKYLKTVVVGNVLYLGGLVLSEGVVRPRMGQGNGIMSSVKLLPLSVLSGAMMYASLPMSMAASLNAQKNFIYYFKNSPKNYVKPLFIGGCCLMGCAVVLAYLNIVKDYQDNYETDNSYTRYNKPFSLFSTAGAIAWSGTNLYSLIWVGRLPRKVLRQDLSEGLTFTPFHHYDGNGLMLTLTF